MRNPYVGGFTPRPAQRCPVRYQAASVLEVGINGNTAASIAKTVRISSRLHSRGRQAGYCSDDANAHP
jgi:hypothetical protein